MMRMIFEDYLYSNSRIHQRALDEFRLSRSTELGIYPELLPTLTFSEIGAAVQLDEIVSGFDALYPEQKVLDPVNYRFATALYQEFKLEIFRNQFPELLEDVVRSFSTEVGEMSRRGGNFHADMDKLYRMLRGCELFNDHAQALISMREPAMNLALMLHDEGREFEARQLMQMASASVYIINPEKCGPQIRHIANDNQAHIASVAPGL